jgi:hypothetical protein
MKTMCLTMAGVIAVLAATPAFAQNVKIQPVPGQPSTGIVGGASGTPLMATEAVEKLKFTADQKDKYGKIEADYKDKAKGLQDTFRTAVKNLGDREKYKEAVEKFQTDSKKAREDALAKVEPILTAAVAGHSPRAADRHWRPGNRPGFAARHAAALEVDRRAEEANRRNSKGSRGEGDEGADGRAEEADRGHEEGADHPPESESAARAADSDSAAHSRCAG